MSNQRSTTISLFLMWVGGATWALFFCFIVGIFIVAAASTPETPPAAQVAAIPQPAVVEVEDPALVALRQDPKHVAARAAAFKSMVQHWKDNAPSEQKASYDRNFPKLNLD